MKLNRLLLSLCVVATPCTAATTEAEFSLGLKRLSDTWEPVENQFQAGFGVNLPIGDQGYAVTIGVHTSTAEEFVPEDGITVTGTVTDAGVGFRIPFGKQERTLPFWEVGIGLAKGTFEGKGPGGSVSDSDQSFGFHTVLGIAFKVGRQLIITPAIRTQRFTDIEMFGVDGNADSIGFRVGLGLSFGSSQAASAPAPTPQPRPKPMTPSKPPTASTPEAQAKPKVGPGTKEQSSVLKEKLETLKDAYEQGLITKEEYDVKRQTLLESY